jgi:lipoate-protein ligase A
MYASLLSYETRPELRNIAAAHRFVLESLAGALRASGLDVSRAGISDLTINGRKFSGNSLRCKRRHLLYHGTVLYNFHLNLIERLLAMPARQPEYRAGRMHTDFVANLPIDAPDLKRALIKAFQADEPLHEWPQKLTAQLARGKYAQEVWTYRPCG